MYAVGQLIIRWQWVFLLVLLPLFLFPSGLHMLVLLLVPLFWIARKIIIGHFVQTSPFDLAILILLIMAAISLIVTYDAAMSLPKLVGLLLGIALFYAILDFSQAFSLWPVVAVYLAGGLLIALIGLIGTNWLPPYEFLNEIRFLLPNAPLDIPGAIGGVINENELAGVLNWIIPLALACLIGLANHLWKNNKITFFLLLLTTILTSFVLIATSSRGGILALSAGVTLVIAFFVSRRWRLVMGLGLIITLSIILSYGLNIGGTDIVGDTLGFAGRIEIWSRAFLAISDYPITGMGFNSFRHVIQILYPPFIIPGDIDLAHAHNHLLQVALDVGLPGLVSYLAIWVISGGLIVASLKKLTRRGPTHQPYYALVVGLAGSLLSGWMFGIFDTIALGSRPAFLWWMVLGLTGSVHYAITFSKERSPSLEGSPPLRDTFRRPPPSVPVIPTMTSRYNKPSKETKP